MTSEKPIDNILEFRSSLLVSAMYTSPGTLLGKLKAIWMLAADLASQAETKHSKLIKPLWGPCAPENSSLALKAQALPKQGNKQKKHSGPNLY